MTDKYVIHPAIGVARVGNSTQDDGFFLAPNEIGGLPLEPDETGPVTEFKDNEGKIKRQGQKFRVYKYDDDGSATEVNLSTEVESFTWTVHLANKKAVWYEYKELLGNLLLGKNNSYETQGVSPRNQDVTGSDRQKLVVLNM